MTFVLAQIRSRNERGAGGARDALRRLSAIPDAECVGVPMVDGGEGTVDAVVDALDGQRVVVDVEDPLGRSTEATYGYIPHRRLAVIEIAEAASDYWRIWFYLLEAAGLDVQLVNAREVKNVPGRPKTDLDAVWLAKLTEKGMLRPSFVPPVPVRQLRDYTRLRIDLTRERTRHWQRLEKLLESALPRSGQYSVAGNRHDFE